MALNDHYYRIMPLRGSALRYVLLDKKEGLGSLTLLSRHGSRAVIHLGNETVVVTRQASLRKHLHIKRSDETAAFTADALSRGSIELGGVKYRWLPRNARWTDWAWHSEDGGEVVRISFHHRFAAYQAEVVGFGGELDKIQQELALLGWYLVLLSQQGFGMHLLTALDLRFRRDNVATR